MNDNYYTAYGGGKPTTLSIKRCFAEGGIIGKCEFPLQFEDNKNFGTLSVDGNKTYVLTNDGIGNTEAA